MYGGAGIPPQAVFHAWTRAVLLRVALYGKVVTEHYVDRQWPGGAGHKVQAVPHCCGQRSLRRLPLFEISSKCVCSNDTQMPPDPGFPTIFGTNAPHSYEQPGDGRHFVLKTELGRIRLQPTV